MKSNSKRNDPVRDRYNKFSLTDVVNNNISLQSTNRALSRDFKIAIDNIKAEYFLGDKFKTKFSTYSSEEKTKLCRLLASLRHKELLDILETK